MTRVRSIDPVSEAVLVNPLHRPRASARRNQLPPPRLGLLASEADAALLLVSGGVEYRDSTLGRLVGAGTSATNPILHRARFGLIAQSWLVALSGKMLLAEGG